MEALLVLGDIPAALEVKPGIFDHFISSNNIYRLFESDYQSRFIRW